MKRATLFVLLFLCAGVCHAMSKYSGYCLNASQSLNASGPIGVPQAMGSFSQCTVTVFVAGTNAIAAVFSDNQGTILSNPFPSDQLGLFFLYVTSGSRAGIQLSGAGMIGYTSGDAPPFDVSGPLAFPNVTQSFTVPGIFSTAMNANSGKTLGGLFKGETMIDGNMTDGETAKPANLDAWTVVDGSLFPRTNAGIQAAVDATPNGGTVFLPNGIYMLVGTGTEEILLKRPINFVCEGWGSILQVGSSVPNTTDVIRIKLPSGVTTSGIQIHDCFITSQKTAQSTNGRYGISIDTQGFNTNSLGHSRISHNFIGFLGGNYSIAVINPPTAGNGAVYLTSIDDNALFNGGILLAKTGDSINIQRNQITYFGNMSATSSGVELDSIAGASHNVISNNNITTRGGCLLVHAAIQPKFEFNQCEQVVTSSEMNSAMVDLNGDDGGVDTALIMGNNLNTHENATSNIRVNNASNTMILNNEMNEKAGTGVGINITRSASGSTVGPNTYFNVSGGAVPISDSGTKTQIFASSAISHPGTQLFASADSQSALTLRGNSATQQSSILTIQDSLAKNLLLVTPRGDIAQIEHSGGIFAQSGKDACGADSATHALLCSFNNDAASQVTRFADMGQVFDAAGTQRIRPHIVQGSATLASGTPSTATITLTGNAAFTSSSSYKCALTNGTTASNGVKVTYVSGSSFTITGPNAVTDVIDYICVGN